MALKLSIKTLKTGTGPGCDRRPEIVDFIEFACEHREYFNAFVQQSCFLA